MKLILLQVLCLVLSVTRIGSSHADDSQPLYIDIAELSQNIYRVKVKPPPAFAPSNAPFVELPASCSKVDPPSSQHLIDGSIEIQFLLNRQYYACKKRLANQQLSIHYPLARPSNSTLIRYAGLDSVEHTIVIGPQERVWQFPEAETKSRVASNYTRLGVQHIWMGVDHLLFVICLLWIASGWRRIAICVTGFTLAHSVTLILSTLKIISVPDWMDAPKCNRRRNAPN